MFLRRFNLLRPHVGSNGRRLHLSTLSGVLIMIGFSLSARWLSAQSVTVVPHMTGDGPAGVMLEGEFTRLDGQSLLGPKLATETPPQRLARRWARTIASKDENGLLDLYFPGDGSRTRMSTTIDQLDTLQPEFRLSSATLLEQLQWDGLTIFFVVLSGNLRENEVGPINMILFAICPKASTCYLVFPQFGLQNRQFETLDVILAIFRKFSTPSTSAQRRAFLARSPIVVALKPSTKYASPEDATVEVKLLVEPYVDVPSTSAVDDPPPAYETRPELKAFYLLLQKLKAMNEGEISNDNNSFRQFINQEFQAEYAANLRYGISRLINGQYVVDMLRPADLVKVVRSWDSVKPACAVHHGNTVFVYVHTGREDEPQSLQLFPVKVVNNHGSFESIRFANYLAGLMRIPELLAQLEKSCKPKRSS